VRLAFDYQVVWPADGARLAEGRTVHAAVDLKGKPCRLPARARSLFA
jgi:acyl-CoA thioesterase FadM